MAGGTVGGSHLAPPVTFTPEGLLSSLKVGFIVGPGQDWEEAEEDTGAQCKELSSSESCEPGIGTKMGAS